MSWQKILADGFSSAAALLDYLNLPLALSSHDAEKQFKTRVPRGFAARMQPGNPQDPLLRQVLAVSEEMQEVSGYTPDPLMESSYNPVDGLIHKYHGRVLLTLTGVCAVNCRYCFRRHFPYEQNNPGRAGWQKALDYIDADDTIHEVILSGGDPLLASDAVLVSIIDALNKMPHVRTLRWHTRIPVVLPERIDDSLLTILKGTSLRKVMVLHCNHPQEIDESVKFACKRLSEAGCFLLNQAVLLKDINDNANVLAELSEALFDAGVLPYYLHVLDKVAGAAHFDLSMEKVSELYRQLQERVPGYLLPKLAREEAGKRSKTLIY